MRILSKYWEILKEDKETGWCLVIEKDMQWLDYDCKIFFMNKKTSQEIHFEFDFLTFNKRAHITMASIIAGFEAFLIVFAKLQPQVNCSWPFYED